MPINNFIGSATGA